VSPKRVLDVPGVRFKFSERFFHPLRLGGAREPLCTSLAETLGDLRHCGFEPLALQGLHDRAEVLAALSGLS
jgi:hypothetical protein